MDCCNMLSWNVRGINKKNKQWAVLDVCMMNKIGIGALLETKIKGDRIKDVMNSNFTSWKFYSSSVLESRILLIWKAHLVMIDILKESDQLLHSRVCLLGRNLDYCLSIVYDDRLGGRPISVKEMEDARQWLALGEAVEMKTLGPAYTWSNKQDGGAHHYFLLIKQVDFRRSGVKPFQFSNMWASHAKFRETVLTIPLEGQGLVKLVGKLTRLKHVLKKFNWKSMGDVVYNYEESKTKFQQAQAALYSDPLNTSLLSKEREAQLDYSRHEKIYASFIRQKSKITWLHFGDENSSFFHASLKQR
ncbi:uncharacterized protein LOC133800201 [Humulus lupulus]|uniref:uncharacterized protein LOC133800201 n=1 Tax=Humulus lupulus TaxID=3486 RepID=UPI002B411F39|nr:uncharacterized protein LOC133800201 [Humulus lupulus]